MNIFRRNILDSMLNCIRLWVLLPEGDVISFLSFDDTFTHPESLYIQTFIYLFLELEIFVFFRISCLVFITFPTQHIDRSYLIYLSFPLYEMSAGCGSVRRHDERNLRPSWTAVQSKHWTVCLTKENPSGTIVISLIMITVAGFFSQFLAVCDVQYIIYCSHLTPKQYLTRSCCLLQAMIQIIDALSTCVRHVGSFEEAPDLESIRSLPTCILKILRETFQHCKVGLLSSTGAGMTTFQVLADHHCKPVSHFYMYFENPSLSNCNSYGRRFWLVSKDNHVIIYNDVK